MAHYGAGLYGAGVYGAESTLTLTELTEAWPSRVRILASGLAEGQVVTVSRTTPSSTVRTIVRGAELVEVDDSNLILNDLEQPYGTLLTYYLTIGGELDGVDNDTATITTTLEGGKVALTDAISGDAAEVVVLGWPSKRRERQSSVFAIGGRNIVVSGQRGGWSGTIEVFTETDESKANVLDILDSATSGILQIRQSGTYDGVDSYFSVLVDEEQRYSQDGSDERRIISLDSVETTAWASALPSADLFDLDDIATVYFGLTLDDLEDDYPGTLLDIALGDFSS
jgi:hypothetical protein